MTETPIACTLAPGELRTRAAVIDALSSDALIERREIPGGLRACFRDGTAVEARVRQLVVAEQQCCAFLTFEVGRDDGGLWLDITGPPGTRPVIDQFFASGRRPQRAATTASSSATTSPPSSTAAC